MIKTFKIFRNSIVRSKLLIALSIIFGITLCFFFNMMTSMITDSNDGGVPLGIMDSNKSRTVQAFKDYLSDDLGISVVDERDRDFLNSELVEKKIAAIIEIPEGFEKGIINGNTPDIEVSYMNDYDNVAFVNSYIDGFVQSMDILALSADKSEDSYYNLMDQREDNSIPVENIALSEDISKRIAEENGLYLVFGFFLMIAFLVAIGFANLIYSDRINGTFDRVRITNVRTVQYLIGMCLSSIVCSLILISIFLAYVKITGTYLVFDIFPLFVLSLCYSLMVVGVALIAAVWLNSNNSIMAAIIGLTTLGCILGGAFFPLDYSPEFLQQLAKITPQYWFMDGFRGIVEGSDSSGSGFNACIIVLFALLFFIIAGVRFAGNKLPKS